MKWKMNWKNMKYLKINKTIIQQKTMIMLKNPNKHKNFIKI